MAEIAVRRAGPAFRVSGAGLDVPAAGWESVFRVYVGESQDLPPVMGTYRVEGQEIVFEPRFPVPAGVAARAVFKGKVFTLAAERIADVPSTTTVKNVFPTATVIPANQLKMYVEFSAPMHKGEAWDHLRLLDEQGKPVELAFLELDQELWDRDVRRLTVLFDPGRIKRGVLPRDEVGSSLEAGRSYTLVVDREWHDARGAKLAEGHRKTFRVGPEDRTAIDEKKWTVQTPKAGTRDPLVVDFGEALDAALALRLVQVQGIEGAAELTEYERMWRFTPKAPWPAGNHRIAVDTALEDLAGNKIGRLFDVDTFERVTVRVNRGTVYIPFRIAP